MENHNIITGKVIDAAFNIHIDLGPGLLESVYESILFHDLIGHGLKVDRQRKVPVCYKGKYYDEGFRADLVIEDTVLVELKSVENLALAHKKQLLTYLKPTDMRVGLLINFGEAFIKNGIHRVVNGL